MCFDLRYGDLTNRGELSREGRKPLRLMFAVLPAFLVLSMHLNGGLFGCSHSTVPAPFGNGIDADFQLRADQRRAFASKFKGNLASTPQTAIAPPPVLLRPNDPAFGSRFADSKEQSHTIAITAEVSACFESPID